MLSSYFEDSNCITKYYKRGSLTDTYSLQSMTKLHTCVATLEQ